MQQPEIYRGHFFQEAADPTHKVIRGKESQIIDTDDGGGQCSGSDACIECERNWKNIGEPNAIQEMKCNQPTKWNFRARGSGDGRPGGEREKTSHRDNTTDADLGNLGRLRIFLRPESPKDYRSGETTYGQD